MSPLLYSARHNRHRGHGSLRFFLLGVALGTIIVMSI
jgi:hypothetical protein